MDRNTRFELTQRTWRLRRWMGYGVILMSMFTALVGVYGCWKAATVEVPSDDLRPYLFLEPVIFLIFAVAITRIAKSFLDPSKSRWH